MNKNDLFDAISDIDENIVAGMVTEKNKKPIGTIIIPMLSSLIVVGIIAGVFSRLPKKNEIKPQPKETPTAQSTNAPEPSGIEDQPTYDETGIPSWYAPKKLETITFTGKKLQAKQILESSWSPKNVEIPNYDKISNVTGARFININAIYSEAAQTCEHYSGYYDIITGDVICIPCLAEKVIPAEKLVNARVVIDNFQYSNKVSLAIWSDAKQQITDRYIFSIDTGELTEMPVLSKNDIGCVVPANDMSHVLTHVTRPTDSKYHDFYLIDTETGEYEIIGENQPTYMTGIFSPDGNNVIILMMDEYGFTHTIDENLCSFVIHNVTTGKEIIACGKVVYFQNEWLLTEKNGEYHLFDLSETEEIKSADNAFAVKTAGKSIVRIDLSTFEENTIVPYYDAYLLSEDGEYVYTYITGDNSIICTSVRSGEKFSVEIDSRFVSAVKDLGKEYVMNYQMQLNETMDEILLFYNPYLAPKLSDADVIRETIRKELSDAAYTSDSIRGIVLKLRTGDSWDLFNKKTASESPNHEYMTLSLQFDDDMSYVFFEDYRNKTFGAIEQYNSPVGFGIYFIYDRGPLELVASDSDYDGTKELMDEFGIPVEEAKTDFSRFFTDGKPDRDKIKAYEASLEFVKNYCELNGHSEMLYDFFDEFDKCDKKITGDAVTGPGFGELILGDTYRILAFNENGKFYLAFKNTKYSVPEYVYQDYMSLYFYSFVASKITFPMSENAKKLNVETLKELLNNGITLDEIKDFAPTLWSDYDYKSYFIPFWTGDETVPSKLVFIRFDSNGVAVDGILLDQNIRYLVDFIRNPEAGFPTETKCRLEFPKRSVTIHEYETDQFDYKIEFG